jgi:hypothetical protein
MGSDLTPELRTVLAGHLHGRWISTGPAGEMWEFNGHEVAVPGRTPGATIPDWATSASGMVKRIAVALDMTPLWVWGVLTASSPRARELAEFLTPQQLADLVIDYQRALNQIHATTTSTLSAERLRTVEARH